MALVWLGLSGLTAQDAMTYPMPVKFNASVIVGKKLKNPFAAKLRLSQRKVAKVVSDGSGKFEESLRSRVKLHTVMFFAPDSPRNRAIINGKVFRPGDEILGMSRRNERFGVRLREIHPGSVVLDVPGLFLPRPIVLEKEDSSKNRSRGR